MLMIGRTDINSVIYILYMQRRILVDSSVNMDMLYLKSLGCGKELKEHKQFAIKRKTLKDFHNMISRLTMKLIISLAVLK